MAALNHRSGDRVRIKVECPTSRGVILAVNPTGLLVRSAPDRAPQWFQPEEITNFSLAARKAWKKMPNRRVGRPKGSTVCDRVSVTIRLDRDLWESFRAAESAGFVTDRTATLNSWIRVQLGTLPHAPKKIAS
jgi:uncharacterized protein (DUF4415 family)